MRLTIGTKLVGLIALLLASSLAGLVWTSTEMFVEDNTALIQRMNADTAESLAIRTRESFKDITDKARILGSVIVQENLPIETRARIAQGFFAKDRDFLAIVVHKETNSQTPIRLPAFVSPELTSLGDTDGAKILATLGSVKDYSVEAMSRGSVQLAPFRTNDGSAAFALGLPFIEEEVTAPGATKHFSYTLTAIIKHSKFSKAMSESENLTTFLVDHRGKLIAHPDAGRAATNEDFSQSGIVRFMLQGKASNGETRYKDPITGIWKLGSFRHVGFAGLCVVSEAPEAKVFEAAEGVRRRSLYFALGILSVAFFLGYGFSRRISKRINRLVEASYRIAEGDFDLSLETRGGDEVSMLSNAFNNMAKGLEERDRVKQTFNKFHNKEIADKLLTGEVKLGGERKDATIFFSDIRGFTAMAESMLPEQVVEMLNEYMTRMVAIIRAHNGIVDKYVGDAIMAIWGVPIGSAGGASEDAKQALQACLAMRAELARFNTLRISRGQVPLSIGMGLNTGSVIAGNIGSNAKMEYTVIGDSVNLASRLESLTKDHGTDLLVTKSIQEKLAANFVFENCPPVRVRGKAQVIDIFKVKGYFNEDGKAVLIETPYSSFSPEEGEQPQGGVVAHLLPPIITTEATRALPPTTIMDDVYSLPREWYAKVGEEIYGPFSESQIRDGIERKRFDETTHLSNNRLGPWKPLIDFKKYNSNVEPTGSARFSFADLDTRDTALPPKLATSAPTIRVARSRSKLTEDTPEVPPPLTPETTTTQASEAPTEIEILSLEATAFDKKAA